MHWRRSLRFSLSEQDHTKWSKQNERRSVWRSSRVYNEWKEVVELSTTEQSTFKYVTRRARSSENRNAVNIKKSCRTLNNSWENCLKLRNEQEMQSQTHWLKQQFLFWSSQSASTSLWQRRIRWKWCFRLTFHHLQRFSCWTQKTSSIHSRLKMMFHWSSAICKEWQRQILMLLMINISNIHLISCFRFASLLADAYS